MTEDIFEIKRRPCGPWTSQLDEDMFFAWLDKIKCVKKYEGILNTLYIDIDTLQLDRSDFDEIIGLFTRYDVNMKQLAVLAERDHLSWIGNKDSHWYELVFGDETALDYLRETKDYIISRMVEDLES